jgi:hypothetical protein
MFHKLASLQQPCIVKITIGKKHKIIYCLFRRPAERKSALNNLSRLYKNYKLLSVTSTSARNLFSYSNESTDI